MPPLQRSFVLVAAARIDAAKTPEERVREICEELNAADPGDLLAAVKADRKLAALLPDALDVLGELARRQREYNAAHGAEETHA